MKQRPVRVLHGADFHIGLTRYGSATGSGTSSRVEDFLATLTRFVDTAIEREADAVVFAGDTFNWRQQSPAVRSAFAHQLWRLRSRLTIVLPGNHDGQTTVGDRDSHSLRYLHELRLLNLEVPLQPLRAMTYMTDAGPLNVTAYPYPHKRALDAMYPDLDPEERVLKAGELLEAHIADVAGQLPDDAPRLFVGHLTVGGATVGSEQAMKMTWDVAITPHVLEAWDYAALGHIHRQQKVPGSTKAWYAGSPEYVDFGEVNDPKGFLLVEVERGKEPKVEVIPSGARRMVKLVMPEGEDGTYRFDLADIPGGGPIVLAEFHPRERPNLSAQAAIERALFEAGASFIRTVTVTPPKPEQKRIVVGSGDVADALDIAAVTEAHLVANNIPVEPTMTAARQAIAAVGGPQ